jgi:hypothetical protein
VSEEARKEQIESDGIERNRKPNRNR